MLPYKIHLARAAGEKHRHGQVFVRGRNGKKVGLGDAGACGQGDDLFGGSRACGGKKNRGEGALIGAGVGALTGNLLGRNKDRVDEQRAAYGAARVGQLNQQVAAQAVTNYDLLEMTRAGVSEDVIISTMRFRGARLDLSPNSLIALKQSGVSDRVVMAAQGMNPVGAPLAAPVPVVTEVVRPTRVYIAPAPWPCYDPWDHCHWDHHWHGHHHGHGHVHIGF